MRTRLIFLRYLCVRTGCKVTYSLIRSSPILKSFGRLSVGVIEANEEDTNFPRGQVGRGWGRDTSADNAGKMNKLQVLAEYSSPTEAPTPLTPDSTLCSASPYRFEMHS